ncbi:gamma-glutamyl-gamma-aminobutyrate hydrolase family protein [Terricaulis sp.]|uniref:gamma-glutamyl-gamma-aminobutyrate hydrolase family protein n=1 Tax=Terricaulis sp. TaxID=2768686 RepID=UPI003782F4FE
MSATRTPGRVILTYGRSLMALVIARSLASRGVEVIGCDDVGMTVLSFSKHVQENFTVAPWDTEPERFLDDLQQAVLDYAPRDKRPYVLMPVFREIELIARHRERFEPTIKLAAPPIQAIEKVTPKHRLMLLADEFKLDTPETWRPGDFDTLKAISPSLPYPVIVKPDDGAGGRGISKAANATEVEEQAAALGFDIPPLIQECIDGEDYCVPVLAAKGEIKAIMAYRNLATFPREAGAGAVRETVDAEPFRKSADALVKATNWDGIAQLDFRWSGKSEDAPKLIEVNARFWAGIFHSMETGVDFPWLLYRHALGEDPQHTQEPDIGATTKTSGAWLLATLEDVAASDPHFSAAGEAWKRAKRRIKSGHVLAAIENAGKAAGEALSVGAALDQLRDALSDLKDAPSELSQAKDPLVGLGALFVLSSLVRHGKLPPEVTYEAEEPAEETRAPTLRKRPVIGITKPDEGDILPWWAMKFAVWLAGGEPVKVTARAPRDPHSIDGLIFGGGSDVYPKRYQGKPKDGYRYDLARGDMEASWALAARKHDLPVLGVCRGAQMLNVLAGGTLHADLSEFGDLGRPKNIFWRLFHRLPIKIRKRSELASITQCPEQMQVNAIHEQAIDRLGAELLVSAREPTGVIQAIEDPSRAFWIGVQFHPEFLIYRAPFRRLFKSLVEAARVRSDERRAAYAEEMERAKTTSAEKTAAATETAA